ncbi:MAG: DUF4388 domain-containing protein, partial [Myxococcales bacterium]|nr:DUF4388 domain-containing protein [Myxococcales bacterium]
AQPALVPTGWGAAPRTDPLLTTSDALQRWRPPGQTDEPKEESIDDMVPANVERGPKSTALVAGSLGLFWVPRLLRFMEAARLTGCLSLNSLHGTGEVSFRSGRLTGATASNRASLATVLQQGDRLRPEQRARLGDTAWAQDNGEALLDRLIDAGLFDAPNVNAAVIDQVFETVDELLRWNAGWFTLRTQAEPPMPPGRRPARLPLAALLSGVEDAREVEPTMVGAKMRAPRIEGSTRDPRLEARIRAQRQHLERTPTDVRARLRLGQLLMRAEDFVEAAGELLNGLTTSTDPRLIKLLGAAIDGLAQAGPRRGSEQVLSVGLCGRLGRINLVQLLEMAAQERITGAFRLIAPEGLAEIRLVDGLLTGATNTNTARLGDVIRASGLVSGEQVEQLVERQHQRNRWTPLGRLAIEAGFLTPERLRDLLQKQMRLALLESGRWRRAHFTFEVADRQLAGDPQRDLDADTILRDLRRMVAPTR